VLFVHNLDAKPREVTFSAGLEGVHIGGSAWAGWTICFGALTSISQQSSRGLIVVAKIGPIRAASFWRSR